MKQTPLKGENLGNGRVVVYRECPHCGKRVSTRPVTWEAVRAWQNGMPAQHAFPELTAAEREIFLTGICNPCWDALFREPEEDSDDA